MPQNPLAIKLTSSSTKRKRPQSGISISGSRTYKLSDTITISETQHTALLKHLKDRLEFGKPVRDALADRFEVIDKALSGFIRLDKDDTKRQRDNEKGDGPKAVDQVLPLVLTQLDEALTYLMTVIAPDDGMYSAISTPDKQEIAKGFASLMNKNDKKFKHYEAYSEALFDMLKYNAGGMTVEWDQIIGNKLLNDDTGSVKIEKGVVFSGNNIEAIDMYNFIYDISVPLIKVNMEGEFFALVKLETPFRLRRMMENQEIFGVDEKVLKSMQSPESLYYRQRPVIRSRDPVSNEGTDWTEILTAGVSQEMRMGYERVVFYGWLRPNEFGLSNSKEYQIWRFDMLNANRIVSAVWLNNAHGMLPCALGRPWNDKFEAQTKSFAEHLMPYQNFASFQLNVHQRSARKALYGATFYNDRMFPDLANTDLMAAKVPFRPPAHDNSFDGRKHVFNLHDTPDTQNTLQDISAVDDLMQRILPTNMLRQVADLERATQYQAAATVQSANRRNHKIAKTANSQCLVPLRDMQMFNIFQYQERMEILDDKGEPQIIDPGKFREASIEYDISDGLKGIDKLSIFAGLRDVINMLLQSQKVSEVDILKIIDYWMSFVGEKTDFTQFKYKTEFDALPIEQRQIAFQLFQQAMAQQEQQKQPGGNGQMPIMSAMPGMGGPSA